MIAFSTFSLSPRGGAIGELELATVSLPLEGGVIGRSSDRDPPDSSSAGELMGDFMPPPSAFGLEREMSGVTQLVNGRIYSGIAATPVDTSPTIGARQRSGGVEPAADHAEKTITRFPALHETAELLGLGPPQTAGEIIAFQVYLYTFWGESPSSSYYHDSRARRVVGTIYFVIIVCVELFSPGTYLED